MTAASNDLRARFGSLRSEDVVALDHAAQKIGISTLQLMEIAGWQVARCAWHLLGDRPGTVAVVAGRGNNGGDGLVAARHLATWGCDVRAWVIAAETELSGLVASHVETARRCFTMIAAVAMTRCANDQNSTLSRRQYVSRPDLLLLTH